MYKINSLSEELNKWYKEKCQDGSLSWTNLHKSTGVSVPYIVKLAQGKGNPSYEKEKALLTETCDDLGAVYEYLKERHPKAMSKYDSNSFAKSENKARKFVNEQSVSTVKNSNLHRVYQLSSSGSYSVKEVVDIMGKSALKHIDYLKTNEVILVKDGIISRNPSYKNTIRNDFYSISSILKYNLDYLEEKYFLARDDEENSFNNEQNKIGGFAKNLNDEGIQVFTDDLIDFFKKEIEKLNDKKYVGDTPVYFNFIFGRFDDK